MSNPNRVPIGGIQRTRMLQEVGGVCPFCGLELIGSLQIHHIDHNPSNTVDENLIAVCGSCHDQLTKHLIPDSQVHWRKLALQHGVNPGKREQPSMNVSHTDNRGGVIAQNLHAEKVVVQNKPKPTPIILEGSIASSTPHYNYVEYLIKRLTTFRQAGASFGQKRSGKIHAGGTRSILENEFGALPKNLPLEEFQVLVARLMAKIDNTALGRRNNARGIPNYHSFEEHGRKKRIRDEL